ncbi:unnamed protein product [Effrenium voratum]|nr:unnamed protein product [Effrenium voratum]
MVSRRRESSRRSKKRSRSRRRRDKGSSPSSPSGSKKEKRQPASGFESKGLPREAVPPKPVICHTQYVFRPQIPTAGCSCGKVARNLRRRTKPEKRPKNRLVARRALRVKDIQATSRQRMASPPPAPSPGNKKRDLVVDRLRGRLVERRSSELVAALERRHGQNWPRHVLEGGFHADEAMRRMCEAFGLRPELERRVLALAMQQAEAWPSKVPFALSSPSTSDDETISTRCDESAGGRSRSSSFDSEDSLGKALLPGPMLWRASWRLQVLNSGAPQDEDKEEDETQDKEALEEEELSRRLREAIANAERQAGSAQEAPEPEPVREKVQSMKFEESEICFFIIDESGITEDLYHRKLQTKDFDGPSGHKARKASCLWCGEDSDAESGAEDDWKDQCDEMEPRSMGQLSMSRAKPAKAAVQSPQAEDSLAKATATAATTLSTVAEVNTAGGAYRVIPTPGNLIGGLMGRGGTTITAIRKNHPGVTIKVNQPQGNALAQIIITGDPKMVPSAEVAVCEALMSGPGPAGARGVRLEPSGHGRMRLPGNKLLCFAEVCAECRSVPGEEVKRKAPRQAKSKPASKEAEREGSAFNNSVFLSSVATDADKAEPPLLE